MKTLLKQIIGILLFSAAVAVAANLVHPRRIPWVGEWKHYIEGRARKEQIKTIPFRSALDAHRENKYLFIDARPEEEYNLKHIKGALSLPLQAIDDHLDTLERVLSADRPAVIYCRNRECDDGLILVQELREMGAGNLFLYVDGFSVWDAAGAPVEAGHE